MPLHVKTLATVSIKLHIALSSAASSSTTLLVIEDPQFDFAIVSTRGKKSIFEGIPLQILDVARVALNKRLAGIKVLLFGSADYGNGCLRSPSNGNHFTVGSDTVLLVAVTSSRIHHGHQRVEFQVRKRPRVINCIHHTFIFLFS